MTNPIDERRAEPVTDEEVREFVEMLRDGRRTMSVIGAYDAQEAADLIERLAQKVKDLTAEKDDAWRICATWRERAHAAEAKEIPAAEGESE